MWDLIVSVPDHCLSFYFASRCYRFFPIMLVYFPVDNTRMVVIFFLSVDYS